MCFIQILLILTISIQKTKQRSTPVTKSPSKTCPDTKSIDYIEFNDIQSKISSKIQQNGKTLSLIRPANFQLDPCTPDSNKDFFMDHVQYITAWVKLESNTFLSPLSKNFQISEQCLLMKTAKLKPQYFFGATESDDSKDEDLNKMMIPTKHQTWIFLLFKIKKIYSSTLEFTKLNIWRTFSENEGSITSSKSEFDPKLSLLEKCTSMKFNDRSNYNDKTLTLKTDVCRFKAIKEIFIPKIYNDFINIPDFHNFLAFGGKMEVINRWNFHVMDRKILEKLWDGKPTKTAFNNLMNLKNFGGFGIFWNSEIMKKLSSKLLDIDSKKEVASTSIIKISFHKKNLGFIKQKFYFKMKNENLGISETLLEFELLKTSSMNTVSPKKFDSNALVTLHFYQEDSNGKNVKEETEAIKETHSLLEQEEESEEWFFSISIELLPESISEDDSSPAETTRVLVRATIEMGPYVRGDIQDYHFEKISSAMKILKIKAKFHKDNIFFFSADRGEKENTLGSYESTFNDVTHLSGGGSHKEALKGIPSQVLKVKDTLKGKITDYSESGFCMWKSLFGFECPHCTLGYRKYWFNEEDCSCKTNNFVGLGYKDGCLAAYNSTTCRLCAFFNGYFLDFFRRGKCKKISEKCPDGFGSYSHYFEASVTYWPSMTCLTCPINCKKCFYVDKENKFYFCRESFQNVLDDSYNTTGDIFKEPTCAITNCEVCEREECDLCKKNFMLKVDIKAGKKQLVCVSSSNNRCPTGYIEARNSSDLHIPNFCFSDSAPPYGYYKKDGRYEACPSDCPLCSIKSQIDLADPLLTKTNPLCQSCEAAGKFYKPFHPAIDSNDNLCFEKKSIQDNCAKKNLTNDCSECATAGDPTKSIVRTSSFSYECSCSESYYDDFIHNTGCKSFPHNCEFPSLDQELGVLVCKRCKKSHPRDTKTGFCSSDCIEQCSRCKGNICDECYQGYFLSLDKTKCSISGCPTGVGQIRSSSDSYFCKNCLSSEKCSECNEGYFLSSGKMSCESSCPVGEGEDTTTDEKKICKKCSTDSCGKCEKDFKICEECETKKLKIQNSTGVYCVSSCPEGTFYSVSSLNCVECKTENCIKFKIKKR